MASRDGVQVARDELAKFKAQAKVIGTAADESEAAELAWLNRQIEVYQTAVDEYDASH